MSAGQLAVVITHVLRCVAAASPHRGRARRMWSHRDKKRPLVRLDQRSGFLLYSVLFPWKTKNEFTRKICCYLTILLLYNLISQKIRFSFSFYLLYFPSYFLYLLPLLKPLGHESQQALKAIYSFSFFLFLFLQLFTSTTFDRCLPWSRFFFFFFFLS